MRLAITCHFKQNDQELLRAAAVTRVVGVERILRSESGHLVDTAEQNSPAASAGNGARDLSITNLAL